MNAEKALAVLDSVIQRSGHIVASDVVQARAFFAELVRRETAMQAAIEKVCRRMQMDIDDGSRPDQWSMQDMQRTLRDAANITPQEPQA